MAREEFLIGLLGDELQRVLGDSYVVNQSLRSDWIDPEHSERPDLVIWPKDDPQRLFLVEAKLAANSQVDLPIAAAGQMVRIFDAYRVPRPQPSVSRPEPVVILATTASVSSLLRSELAAQRIDIVDDTNREALVNGIAATIEARRKQGADAEAPKGAPATVQ